MEDRILQLLVETQEISWKQMIYDLVNGEGMNPWDVNISSLAEKFIDRVRKFKEMDLKISGKVLLAAAILLKIKSKKLIGDDLTEFDRLIASVEEFSGDNIYDELEKEIYSKEKQGLNEKFELMPRTPLPRKRKVSVQDLILALEKALEVKNRRVNKLHAVEMKIPEKRIDIGAAIVSIYDRIKHFFSGSKGLLTFSQLVPSPQKLDKVYTFIPLLHLCNDRKIVLDQEQHFGEINISLFEEDKNGGE